ncbi:unnamed protein product [Orchesella dallaii]|uniref:Elongation of very long chain fatty acids protein n=2 Tax=Orchesella dallaii TaxID=48710 RepID=A0ABP1R0K2_9HEXA
MHQVPSSLSSLESEAHHHFEFGNVFTSGHAHMNQAYAWENFDFLFWRGWMSKNFHLAVLICFSYVALVFTGRRWMINRHPYKLKTPLVLWNIAFAAFSFAAFWRTFPDLWLVVWQKEQDGFYKSVCSSEGLTVQFAFWSWIGVFSKLLEMGDTIFIVLRKQPLIFLHWYHHAATMLYTWFTFPSQEPCHRWLMTMNFFVHIFMYSYYALRAGGIKLPRLVAMLLTTTQQLQMVIGIYINWYTWKELGSKRGCERYHFNLVVAAVMYISYLILFANFFYNSYFKPIQKKKE